MSIFQWFRKDREKIPDGNGRQTERMAFIPSASSDRQLQEQTEEYHRKMGVIGRYPLLYTLTFLMLGRKDRFQIQVPGSCSYVDVVQILEERGFLRQDRYYEIHDWPHVSELWGLDYKHVRCWVCELPGRNMTFRVEEKQEDNFVTIYGCPNADAVLEERKERKISVIRYYEEA